MFRNEDKMEIKLNRRGQHADRKNLSVEGVKVVLDRHQDLQVLWKWQSSVMDELKAVVGAEIEGDGRVKIRS